MSIDAVEPKELNASDIEAYLREHPEFFSSHPDLVRDMVIPHHSGSAVSLLEHQVTLLRNRNNQFHSRLDTLLTHAKENDRKFQETRKFVLDAIRARDLAELSDAVERSLYDDFGVESCSFILFSEHSIDGVRTERILDANRHIGNTLTGQKAICGEFPANEMQWLFQRSGIKSAAIAPLQKLQLLGILAVGHPDASYYRLGTGTLFLNYVSEVLSELIPNLSARDTRS